jgi:hypothetical protein
MDLASELNKLAELRYSGILTEAEFQQQKAAALERNRNFGPNAPAAGRAGVVSHEAYPPHAVAFAVVPTQSPARDGSLREKVFMQEQLEDGAIMVSSKRVILGSQVFVTKNISSVRVVSDRADCEAREREKRSAGVRHTFWAILFLFAGAALPILFLVAVGFGIAAIAAFSFKATPTWGVSIMGGGGNTVALESKNRAAVDRVVAAINSAVMSDG